jgi:hypothetical protein
MNDSIAQVVLLTFFIGGALLGIQIGGFGYVLAAFCISVGIKIVTYMIFDTWKEVRKN